MRAISGLRLERLRAQPWFVAGLLYLGLSLLSLLPTLATFARAVPGGAVAQFDGWQNVWNLWWFERAVTSGANPFFTRVIFYPQGVDLVGQTLTATNGLLVLPITAAFGPVAGYNAAVLLSFVLSGLGGYALTRHVTQNRRAAFVGGCVLAFAPFHMTKVWDGQLELIAIQWLPFYLLFLVRSAEAEGRIRDALLAGLFLALVAYTSWYYLYFAALASLLAALLWLPYRAGLRSFVAAFGRLALAAIVAGLLIAPAIGSLVESAFGRSGPSASSALLPARSATLLDFFLPSYLHPLWGAWVAQIGGPWHAGVAAWNVSLGSVALLLACVALWHAPGAAWRWLILILAACLLALGPSLHIGPLQTGIPLPYAALATLPGGNLSHRPGHFVVIAVVALAPLAGLGMSLLLARWNAPARNWLFAGVLLALAWEYLPPRWQLWEPVTHPYYQQLAGEPGALLVLPAQAEDPRPLFDQVRHGRPIMGGLLARSPEYDPPRAPGLRDLWRADSEPARLLPTQRAEALAALNYYGVGEIVIERTRMQAGEATALAKVLPWLLPDTAPLYEDERLQVYRVPEAPARPFAFFAAGWHREEHQDERSWRWMKGRSELVLVNPTAELQKVSLVMSLESYQQPREIALSIDGASLGSWEIPAQPGRATKVLHFWLPSGEHRLALVSLAPTQIAPDNRELSVVITAIELRSGAGE